MNKIKNKIIYIFGAILAFIFKYSGVSAMAQIKYGIDPYFDLPQPEYGVFEPTQQLNLWEKILNIILSPLFITIFLFLAFTTGIFIFLKKRKKKRHHKKN